MGESWSWNGASFGAVNRVGTTTTAYTNHEWFAIPLASSKPVITSWTAVAP